MQSRWGSMGDGRRRRGTGVGGAAPRYFETVFLLKPVCRKMALTESPCLASS